MSEILQALKEKNFGKNILTDALQLKDEEQDGLFEIARQRRDAAIPSREVEVRSVLEISNICAQRCNFCNIGNLSEKKRYTIDYDTFMNFAENLYLKGRRVFLLQSGENRSQKFVDHVSRCVRGIKSKYSDIVLILCLGNLSFDQFRQLKEAGAKRYILKFETSNSELYSRLKPRDTLKQRLNCLDDLLSLDYQVGSGNMVGLPGQTIEDIVNDLLLLGRYKMSMSSCTVFIPGEDSNYRDKSMGDVDIALNMLALIRIMYPDRLIPATSAFEKARKKGQHLALMAGANTVTIHDLTPKELKELFPIYSTKRFTPDADYIEGIVQKSNLKLARGPLR